MLRFSSIEDFHEQLKEGKTSCRLAVEYYLQRIQSQRHLNAFIEVFAEEALQRADELDRQYSSGTRLPLHGVVIALKDVICYKDHKVSAASRILQNFTSLYSATAVDRLIDAGAIIIGNCNCDEFAMGSTNENSWYGKVLNAADETRVPGGSSGGSAVAVQAGCCMASLGSDTGGSVRQPADFCGIVGLKPSYGRISRFGLIAYASSFDQIGIFSRTVRDAALLLQVMAGADEFDSTVSQRPVPVYDTGSGDTKYRFAYFPEALEHPAIDKEIAEKIRERADKLKEEGHTVEPVSFNLLDHIVPAYYVLTTAEASSNLSRYDGVRYGYRAEGNEEDLTAFYKKTRSTGFSREVKRRIMLGSFVLSAGYYDAYFTRAQKVRQLLWQRTAEIFTNYDFIIMPTSPVPAFHFGEKMNDPIAMYLADIYTVMANLVGCPAISLPLFKHSNNMPFGLQVMANRFNEVNLLRLGHRLMTN